MTIELRRGSLALRCLSSLETWLPPSGEAKPVFEGVDGKADAEAQMTLLRTIVTHPSCRFFCLGDYFFYKP